MDVRIAIHQSDYTFVILSIFAHRLSCRGAMAFWTSYFIRCLAASILISMLQNALKMLKHASNFPLDKSLHAWTLEFLVLTFEQNLVYNLTNHLSWPKERTLWISQFCPTSPTLVFLGIFVNCGSLRRAWTVVRGTCGAIVATVDPRPVECLVFWKWEPWDIVVAWQLFAVSPDVLGRPNNKKREKRINNCFSAWQLFVTYRLFQNFIWKKFCLATFTASGFVKGFLST